MVKGHYSRMTLVYRISLIYLKLLEEFIRASLKKANQLFPLAFQNLLKLSQQHLAHYCQNENVEIMI